jgi:hypothetical protein
MEGFVFSFTFNDMGIMILLFGASGGHDLGKAPPGSRTQTRAGRLAQALNQAAVRPALQDLPEKKAGLRFRKPGSWPHHLGGFKSLFMLL